MRFLIALASGIGGLLCLTAVMGGFRPALQTIVIGVILLLIAYIVPKLGRGGGGAPKTDHRVQEQCNGTGRVGIGGEGFSSMRICPDCRQLKLATNNGVMLEHYLEQTTKPPVNETKASPGKKKCAGSGTTGVDPKQTPGANYPYLLCKVCRRPQIADTNHVMFEHYV
jgi:hypothetical protein